jgi:hypothetical protein
MPPSATSVASSPSHDPAAALPAVVVSASDAVRLRAVGPPPPPAVGVVLTLGGRAVAAAPSFDALWSDWGRVRAALARAGGKKGAKEWGGMKAPW